MTDKAMRGALLDALIDAGANPDTTERYVREFFLTFALDREHDSDALAAAFNILNFLERHGHANCRRD